MTELWLRASQAVGFSLLSAIVAQPALAQITQVRQVRIEEVEDGINLILETADGDLPELLTSRDGTTWSAEIANTQLAEGASLDRLNPAPGIDRVIVESQAANSIRITVVGSVDLPVVEVDRGDGMLVLNARVPVLDIVVVGEQIDSEYFVPETRVGTRTPTDRLEIPQSIQVIPEQLLEDQQAIELDEAIVNNTSGVVVNTTEGSGFRFAIRGFDRANILRDGFNLSASDGIRSGLSVLSETANLERIEVLRGPASILYGDLNPGGVINLVTKQPLADPFYEVGLQVGDHDFFRPSLDVTGPLTGDERVRYRLNALYENDNGFRDFDQNMQRFFIAPVVAWEIDDRTNLSVELEYLNDERPYDTGTLAFGDGIIDIPRDRIANEFDDSRDQNTFIAGYTFEHEFNDNWEIRNALRYGRQSVDGRVANPVAFNESTGIVTRLDAAVDNFRESVALQTNVVGEFETGAIGHTLLFGADFSTNSTDRLTEGNFTAPLILNIFDPVYDATPRDESRFLPALDEFVRTNRFGIYLQDQISFTDQLILVAGLRYDTVEQNLTTDETFQGPNRIPGDSQSQDNDAWTPRIGLVYQPTSDLALYTSYSRSFTPNFSTTVDGDFLEPEEGEGFEVGVKTEFLDDRLFASLSYFNITRQNVAVPDPDAMAVFNAFIGTGEQNSEGIEFDVVGEILPGWNVVASYSYIDAEVTEDTVIDEGNNLIGIPEHSASLWTTYRLQSGDLEGLGFGLGINYVGDREGDINNSFELDDYFLTNAAIFYERDNWELAVNFKNIFDVEYITGIPINRVRNIEVGEPFTVLFSISTEF